MCFIITSYRNVLKICKLQGLPFLTHNTKAFIQDSHFRRSTAFPSSLSSPSLIHAMSSFRQERPPNPPTTYPSHTRSRSLLALPVTPAHRKYPRKPGLPTPRLILFATLASAGFLLSYASSHLHLFRPGTPVVSPTFPGPSTELTSAEHSANNTNALTLPETNSANSESPNEPTADAVDHNKLYSDTSNDEKERKKGAEEATSETEYKRATPTITPEPVAAEDTRDPADFSTFNATTALNYFHMHKTGGVSFKERLFDFFMMDDTVAALGRKPNIFDTCHISSTERNELGLEKEWSCDWDEMIALSEEARNKIDVIMGHQYWERGAGYWIPNRDLRYFTVMRHPLHRKISFFYHFFVRNVGRKEDSVTTEELANFVLGEDMPKSPLIRDAGPGYYASRLWSDGLRGYDDNHRFAIPTETAASMVYNSIRRLRKNFVFIGLQTQEPASLCMLRKTIEAFAKAHRFKNVSGLEAISKQRERMNTGSYPISAKILWQRMSGEQKKMFRRVERVDLGIYRESVKMFHEMVKRFGCEDLVVESDEDTIAM